MSAAPRPRDPPRATYRLQLNREFDFRAAAAAVPYLARLGISHAYVSPVLKSRAGSSHGYDVIDHSQLDPELGGDAGFAELTSALRTHGLGLIVDIVPNHIGVFGDDNAWWLDVLENGPAAEHARFFDIDWQPDRASMRNRVLVPVLGAPYGEVLERGELRLAYAAATGAFEVRHHEHLFPIDPRDYPRMFAATEHRLHEALPPDDPDRQDLESLLHAFGRLPERGDTSPEARAERYRDKEAHKRRLVRLCERAPRIAQHIRATIEVVNGRPGDARSFDALNSLLEAQAYRLSYWRVATDEINYRRFFDVNHLAALRMDDPDVFAATHGLILDLTSRGLIDGLRIDHPDGLYDPQQYLERLQRCPGPEPGRLGPPYVVAEKVLARHERLPDTWPVHGTTGYDFASLATAWLVNPATETRLTRLYRDYAAQDSDFPALCERSKRLVMRISLAAEVAVLATQLDRIAQYDRHTADFTRAALRDAIVDVIASFPVYRTYVTEEGPRDEDRRLIRRALGIARTRSRAADVSVFDFLESVLTLEHAREASDVQRRATAEFAMKFQQVTAPVMAKGVEDTAFYLYHRLSCLNEVGSDPQRFGVSTQALHLANAERARDWPLALLATSTHDTKRSEDVRARIAVLSELPEAWQQSVGRWTRLNRTKHRQLADGPAPCRNDEYLLYQTLLGLWPDDGPEAVSRTEFVDRVQAYMLKAAREAKTHTSWLSPAADYEEALQQFVARVLAARSAFLQDFAPFAERVAYFGGMNSLAQTTLKLTCPGVPDVYQGAEDRLLTLVDPDNREPVDFRRAAFLLDRLSERLRQDGHAAVARELSAQPAAGAAKLFVTHTLLALRGSTPALGTEGGYEPIRCVGALADHICAYARVAGEASLLTIAVRWFAQLTAGEMRLPLGPAVWRDTRLEWTTAAIGTRFEDAFTRRRLSAHDEQGLSVLELGQVLTDFPLAVLAQVPAG